MVNICINISLIADIVYEIINRSGLILSILEISLRFIDADKKRLTFDAAKYLF